MILDLDLGLTRLPWQDGKMERKKQVLPKFVHIVPIFSAE